MGGTDKKEATGKKRMYLPISKTDWRHCLLTMLSLYSW